MAPLFPIYHTILLEELDIINFKIFTVQHNFPKTVR